MKWNDLTMKERSDLMSLFLKAGVGSLSDMRHIYDGEQNNELILDEYGGGTLKESKVSATLTRDQWNKLYKEGKVSLSQIPRKYQSWIESENSQFKKGISQAISDSGSDIGKLALTIGSFMPIVGTARDIVDIGTQIATGNYLGAGVTAATALLPGAIGEVAEKVIKSRRLARALSKAELDEKLLDTGAHTKLYSQGQQKIKGEVKQGVKTSGIHKEYGTGRITGSQDVTDPKNIRQVEYGPSRTTKSAKEVPQKKLHIKNASEYFEWPRGEYVEDAIPFDDVIEMSMGMRPQIVGRYKDVNGIDVFPYVRESWPTNKSNRQWLSNKDVNYMWTDIELLPVELLHRNGGNLTFY